MWHPAVQYIGTHVSASYLGGLKFNSRFRSTERYLVGVLLLGQNLE
jgi:hypothetical protein